MGSLNRRSHKRNLSKTQSMIATDNAVQKRDVTNYQQQGKRGPGSLSGPFPHFSVNAKLFLEIKPVTQNIYLCFYIMPLSNSDRFILALKTEAGQCVYLLFVIYIHSCMHEFIHSFIWFLETGFHYNPGWPHDPPASAPRLLCDQSRQPSHPGLLFILLAPKLKATQFLCATIQRKSCENPREMAKAKCSYRSR